MKKLSPDAQLFVAIAVCLVCLVLALQDFLPMVLREVLIIVALLAGVIYIVLFYKNPENRRRRRKKSETKDKE